MIYKIKAGALFFALVVLVSSCGIMGIHTRDHNPRRPASPPVFDKETILLGELSPAREQMDVTWYNLDIHFQAEEKTLSGWVEIKAVAKQDIDSFYFDLDQPLVLDELKFDTRSGINMPYKREYRSVISRLPQTVKKGQVFSVLVRYHGKPVIAKKPPWKGGMVWKHDDSKNIWAGIACETEGASIWFPCKDHTSDEPDSASMRFTIPDNGLMVVSNGQFMGAEKLNGQASFSWKVTYPINLYDITFYLGNFIPVSDSYTGMDGSALQITHYVLKGHEGKAKEHFKQAKEHIRIYENLYGPYPWTRDGFKLVESPYEGMEHQTAIAYGNGFRMDLYGVEDYVMLHETGHEWFGNAVTAADLNDVWLQEGFTTYGEALYLEKKYGTVAARKHLAFYRMMIKNKRPLVGPAGRRYFDYKDGDVYVKGAWVLQTLRTAIGDDPLFFSILQTFYQENKMKTVSSATFIQTVNRLSGINFSGFFKQYLNQNEIPVLEYEYASDGTFYFRWSNTAEDFSQVRIPVMFGEQGKVFDLNPEKNIKALFQSPGTTHESDVFINNKNSLFKMKRNRSLGSMYKNSTINSGY